MLTVRQCCPTGDKGHMRQAAGFVGVKAHVSPCIVPHTCSCLLCVCVHLFAVCSYSKLVYATALIREQQCLFIATNLDHADAISSSSSSDGSNGSNGSNGHLGRVMPGTGSLVAAVQVASGVTPVSVLVPCEAVTFDCCLVVLPLLQVLASRCAECSPCPVSDLCMCGCPHTPCR